MHWTSPPPLTLCSAEPAAVRIAAARSTAHPFTYPEGSNLPPGVVVKYPPLRALMAAHAWSTSASSGAHCCQRHGPAAEPADVAVVPVRREGGVHPVQPAHRLAEVPVAARFPGPRGHVEGDDRAHHVLGVPAAIGPMQAQERLSSALCSDWM